MAKSCNQKGKILYLERMLSETTSENPISMQEILTKLEERGIRAERKSIYDDLEALRDFGMEIHYRRGREGGYFTENTKKTAEEAVLAVTNEGEKTERQITAPGTEEMTAKGTVQKGQTLSGRVPSPVPDQNAENKKELKLVCQNSAKKKILRTFGSEIVCKEKGVDSFTVTVEAVVDKALFGWLASMGRNVHILKPKKVAVAYRDYLKNIARDYKGIDK